MDVFHPPFALGMPRPLLFGCIQIPRLAVCGATDMAAAHDSVLGQAEANQNDFVRLPATDARFVPLLLHS
jgi:hypothetical protein